MYLPQHTHCNTHLLRSDNVAVETTTLEKEDGVHIHNQTEKIRNQQAKGDNSVNQSIAIKKSNSNRTCIPQHRNCKIHLFRCDNVAVKTTTLEKEDGIHTHNQTYIRHDNDAQCDTQMKHKPKHIEDQPHQCNNCGKVFTCASKLKRHSFTHTGEKHHQCNICHKSFSVASMLKRHSLIHSKVRSYQCNVCNKRFIKPSRLKRHSLIHSGLKSHQCEICNKTFTLAHHLKRHLLLIHKR